MNKPKFETPDMTQKNIDKISQMFPNCITETKDENGKLKKAVNFELLQQMLSEEIADKDEAYEFTWVGKKAAIVEANKPIRKTLRPCKEESVNWDTTENLYIEGDNLEVLKLLQESYLGKVKMIYIDPPYNTGNDFVYPDSFIMDNEEYNEGTGYFDNDGNVNFSRENTTSAGKYHSDWCSMMYSRLLLARNLLSDEGVIFISIDDNEHENLKKICDEVFGSENLLTNIIWEKADSPRMDAKTFSSKHDFILLYSKDCKCVEIQKRIINEIPSHYDKTDQAGKKYYLKPLRYMGNADAREDRPNLYYPLIAPDGTEVYPIRTDGTDGRWRWSKEKYSECKNRVDFIKGRNGWSVYTRIYAENNTEIPNETIWYNTDVGSNRTAMAALKEIFGGEKPFPTPKPIELIEKMLNVIDTKNSIILDFFTGSGTTAHAVLKKNANDKLNRKFIMVQLPETTDEKSEAYKAGYKNICEIGKERIRRAGKKIKEENPDTTKDLDIGFRVLKVADSNMKDVYYSASEYDQSKLDMFESNIKEDRNDLDLLFGCLLDWGLPLSLPYTSETIDKFTVHTYNEGDLVACFNEDVSEDVVKEIARKKPLRAVFRDSSFSNSASKINVFEIFKMISPETSVKVI